MLASPPSALSARALLVTLALGAVHLSPATAQTVGETTGVPVATGARTDTPPVIDGRLDDNVWAAAPTISGFLQHEPFEGRQPTERTEIHILYDATAVYIGAAMFDRRPTGIVTGENRRDADIRDADAILIVLDTFFDRQNAYVFGTTPLGIEYDGQVTKDGEGGISTSFRTQRGAGVAALFELLSVYPAPAEGF